MVLCHTFPTQSRLQVTLVRLCVCGEGTDLHEWGLTVSVFPRLQKECLTGETVRCTADPVFTAPRPNYCPSRPPAPPSSPCPGCACTQPPASSCSPASAGHPCLPLIPSRGPRGPHQAGRGRNLEGHPHVPYPHPSSLSGPRPSNSIRSGRSSPTSAAKTSATLSKGDKSR